jgi:hypothetical protein
MAWFLISFIAAMIAVTIPAHAQGALTGISLYNNCAPDAAPVSQVACFDYVEGFADGISTAEGVAGALPIICGPPIGVVTNQQIALIYRRWAESNPRWLNGDADVNLGAALAQAFPCDRKSQR